MYIFGVDVVVADEFLTGVNMCIKYFEHDLTLGYFYEQHNEHRIVIPKLFYFLVGVISNYNSILLMYMSQVVLILAVFVLVKLVRKQFSVEESEMQSYILLSIPILFFSLRHYQNFLSGFQICFSLVFLFTLMSLYYLVEWTEKSKTKHFLFAIICAVCASLSALQGLYMWFIGGVYMLSFFLLRKIKVDYYSLGIWFVVSGILLFFYLNGLERVEGHPPIHLALGELAGIFLFFMAVVGDLSPNVYLAIVLGIIFTLYFLFNFYQLIVKDKLAGNLIWLTLALYVFVFALTVTASRYGFGDIKRALAGRYCLFSFLLILSNIMIGYSMSKLYGGFTKSLHRIHTFIVILCTIVVTAESFRSSYKSMNQMKEVAYKMKNDIPFDEVEIKKIFVDSEVYKKRITEMKKWKLNIFNE